MRACSSDGALKQQTQQWLTAINWVIEVSASRLVLSTQRPLRALSQGEDALTGAGSIPLTL